MTILRTTPTNEKPPERGGMGGGEISINILDHFLKVNLDNIPLKVKPPKGDDSIKGICYRLGESQGAKVTLGQLLELIGKGISFTEAYLNGGKAEKYFIEQYLICIDIDNKRDDISWCNVEDFKQICIEKNITWAAIYYSFSHENLAENPDRRPKFRAIFILEKPISDPKLMKELKIILISLFPQADSSTQNLDRFFYGTNRTDHIVNPDAKHITVAQILAHKVAPIPKPQLPSQTLQAHKGKNTNFNLSRATENFDMQAYCEREFGLQFKPSGNGWLKHTNGTCPLCGGIDRFCVRENLYKCHGDSCDAESGDVIKFEMRRQGIDKKEASKYFLYQILGRDQKADIAAFKEQKRIERGGADVSQPDWIILGKEGGVEKLIVSAALLYLYIKKNYHYRFLKDMAHGGEMRYWYNGMAYKLVSDNQIKGFIKALIESYDVTLVKQRTITEVFNLLIAEMELQSLDIMNNNEDLICFCDGILNIKTLELKQHSPKFNISTIIPNKWNPNITPTPTTDKFIDKLTNGCKQTENLLYEIIGVIISNIKAYRAKKAVFLVGPGNTGKSKFSELIERIIGIEYCAACDLQEIEARFGTSLLYNKRKAGASDISYMSIKELKNFKKITGGDALFAEFKCVNGFLFTFYGLLLFCCNRLPKFGGDQGEHVFNRMLIIPCNNVIPKEEQDPEIVDKMLLESEGIITKAIYALKEFVERGYVFTSPPQNQQLVTEWRNHNDTARAFFMECCQLRNENQYVDGVTTKILYNFYKAFCEDNNNNFFMTAREFKNSMASFLDIPLESLTKKRPDNNYYPITITRNAYKDYKRSIYCKNFISTNI